MERLVDLVRHNKGWVRDVDVVNDLHHFFTVTGLIGFAFLVGVKTYTTGMLDCWSPNITSPFFQQHVNTYCWSHKLYRYPNHSDLTKVPYALNPLHGGAADPPNSELENIEDINFYRWISVIFLCQALMFTLPQTLWIQCLKYSGFQMERIIALSNDKSAKEADFKQAAINLDVYLKMSRKAYPECLDKCLFCREFFKVLQHILLCIGAETRICLLTSHCIVKFLFWFNLLGQFCIMSRFLGLNYGVYGDEFFKIIKINDDGIDTKNFPRLCLCHFRARGQGYWVQCLLTINMLLEKVFVIEWIWLWILFGITSLNCIVWGYKITSNDVSRKFVQKYMPDLKMYKVTSLGAPEKQTQNEENENCCNGCCRRCRKCFTKCCRWCRECFTKCCEWCLNKCGCTTILKWFKGSQIDPATKTFVDEHLCKDGVFMLRILAANTNDVVMTQLVKCMWELYLTQTPTENINLSNTDRTNSTVLVSDREQHLTNPPPEYINLSTRETTETVVVVDVEEQAVPFIYKT